MCGIVGWRFGSGAGPDPAVLESMSHAIRHRGPDDEASFADVEKGVALAFRRLSIIDLSEASRQPMIESRVALVFNGELYNFQDLREELRKLGHEFRSRGDAEVVLKSYLQWGTECFARFAGMFALAIWDPRSGLMHLARDPMGMKPLYYAKVGGGFLFASEVKAFQRVPGFRFRPNERGLAHYVEFGYVFDKHDTFLDGVHKVPPGYRMEVWPSGEPRLHEYFCPPAPNPDDRRNEDERLDELKSVLERVVQEHLVADVPVGLLLSGGLDSSVVAAIAARQSRLLTISMGFAESAVDERPQARAVADHIGSTHVEMLITAREVMAEVESGAWVFDDLFADWGTITTRLMYRHCREQGIKVVLVGEGADELFGGYDVFDLPRHFSPWRRFRLYQRYAGRRHGRLFGEFREVLSKYEAAGGGDAFHAVRLFESRRQLPNHYVMKVDKASMAEGIEARAPYLDVRVARLAYSTSRDWLLRNGENKYLLRALARRERLLPDQTSQRPKFGAPLAASWMDDNAEFRRFAREKLLEGEWCRRLGLDKAMRAYFESGKPGFGFPSALSIFNNIAWRVLLLELWSRHYMEKEAA